MAKRRKTRTITKTVYRTRNKTRVIQQFPGQTTQLSFQPTTAPSQSSSGFRSSTPLINRFSGFTQKISQAKASLRSQLDQSRKDKLMRVQDESRRIREEVKLLNAQARLAKLKKSQGNQGGSMFGSGNGGFGF